MVFLSESPEHRWGNPDFGGPNYRRAQPLGPDEIRKLNERAMEVANDGAPAMAGERRADGSSEPAWWAREQHEIERVSATGGVRKEKEARWDLISPDFTRLLAILLGRGAKKYADRNWEKGYSWSSSYNSALNHLSAFWAGEDMDEEMGVPHTVCAAFHLMALTTFMTTRREFDDRPGAGQDLMASPENQEIVNLLRQRQAGDISAEELRRRLPFDTEEAYDRQAKYFLSPPGARIEDAMRRAASNNAAILSMHTGDFSPGDEEARPSRDELSLLDVRALREEAARNGFKFPEQASPKALLYWLDPAYPPDAPFKLGIQAVAFRRAGTVAVGCSKEIEALKQENETLIDSRDKAWEDARQVKATLKDRQLQLDLTRKMFDDDRDKLIVEVEAARRREQAALGVARVAQKDRQVAAEANEAAQRALQGEIDRLTAGLRIERLAASDEAKRSGATIDNLRADLARERKRLADFSFINPGSILRSGLARTGPGNVLVVVPRDRMSAGRDGMYIDNTVDDGSVGPFKVID